MWTGYDEGLQTEWRDRFQSLVSGWLDGFTHSTALSKKKKTQNLFLTWHCRGCFHQDIPLAWCSPWLCHGWKSASSGRRTRQEPRSSWPDGHQRSDSCCCWRGRPAGRLASNASDTASWWNPGDQSKTNHPGSGIRESRGGGNSGNVRGAYHVNFRYAVDALNLDVDTNRQRWTYKRSNVVKHQHPPQIVCLHIWQRLCFCRSSGGAMT